MQKKDLSDFIYFGTSTQYLKRARDMGAIPYRGEGFVRYNIIAFLQTLSRNKLKVSLAASKIVLEEVLNDLDEKYTEDDGRNMELSDLERISEALDRLELVFSAEAPEVTAFFPAEKRYNTEYLYEKINSLFGPDVYSRLPAHSQEDFSEAGKCILFERNTAAAYHLMRGAEGALKTLYLSVVKKNRKRNLSWGPMVEHLMERKALDEALKGTLDNFRRGFRNPVAHPEKFYSAEEAQDLLGTTSQLITLIACHPKYDPSAK